MYAPWQHKSLFSHFGVAFNIEKECSFQWAALIGIANKGCTWSRVYKKELRCLMLWKKWPTKSKWRGRALVIQTPARASRIWQCFGLSCTSSVPLPKHMEGMERVRKTHLAVLILSATSKSWRSAALDILALCRWLPRSALTWGFPIGGLETIPRWSGSDWGSL